MSVKWQQQYHEYDSATRIHCARRIQSRWDCVLKTFYEWVASSCASHHSLQCMCHLSSFPTMCMCPMKLSSNCNKRRTTASFTRCPLMWLATVQSSVHWTPSWWQPAEEQRFSISASSLSSHHHHHHQFICSNNNSVKELNILIYFFFPPITQSCSVYWWKGSVRFLKKILLVKFG